MNNEVKSPEDSDFQKMHLVVILDGNDNHMESPYYYGPSSSSSSPEEEIKIKFVNPYSAQEFPEDLQFVMEVEGNGEFVDGGTIGCDGSIRVSARLDDNDGVVILKVTEPSSKLRVWGGWATGHNSVRLTPDLLLEPGPTATTTTTKDDKEQVLKEEEEEEETIKIIGEGEQLEQLPDTPDVSEEIAGTTLERRKTNLLEKPTVPKGLEDMLDKSENGDRQYKYEIIHNKNDDNNNRDRIVEQKSGARTIKQQINDKHADLIQLDRKENARYNKPKKRRDNNNDDNDNSQRDDTGKQNNDGGDHNSVHKDNEVYKNGLQAKMKNNFNNEFDTSRHFVASGFFAITVVIIVAVFGNRRGDKGRRDL